MDYEKKYKEAFEIAKDCIKDGTITNIAISYIETIFPELKESDDERIRKWCISHFNGCISVIKENDEYKEFLSNKVVAWLEKQGETNPYSGVSFKYNGHTWGMCARDNGVEISCDKQFIKQLDEQGEQPRYNIGDVICDESCTTLNKDAQPNMEIVDIKNGMYICDKGSFPVSQQDEYVLVSKKIDMKPVDSVSNELREASLEHARNEMMSTTCPNNMTFEFAYNFEEGAKWQATQKSSWSKDDDDNLGMIESRLIDLLSYTRKDNSLTKHRKNTIEEEVVGYVNWLTSLKARFAWKPSDEQMKELNYAVNAMASSRFARENDCCYNVLKTLRDQLEKLK